MRLLSCIVSHDRAALLRKTVESYIATTTVPHALVIVDSASTDHETIEYLRQLQNEGHYVVWVPTNVYPGAACNEGWALANIMVKWTSADETFMHRSDSDVEYLPGWTDEVERCLSADVGQLGLMVEKYETPAANVGGNCVLRGQLWREGLRWNETPWKPGCQEDVWMSQSVQNLGYKVARVENECIIHHGWDYGAYESYYDRSADLRGYRREKLRDIFEDMKTR